MLKYHNHFHCHENMLTMCDAFIRNMYKKVGIFCLQSTSHDNNQ